MKKQGSITAWSSNDLQQGRLALNVDKLGERAGSREIVAQHTWIAGPPSSCDNPMALHRLVTLSNHFLLCKMGKLEGEVASAEAGAGSFGMWLQQFGKFFVSTLASLRTGRKVRPSCAPCMSSTTSQRLKTQEAGPGLWLSR